jgi:dTDP-4-dehydrorhamnose reductase
MMRILLLGKNGQIGWELHRSLSSIGIVRAVGRTECDLTDLAAVRRMVSEDLPDVIVNAAAYTAVDRAESEPEVAHLVNATLPAVLAELAATSNASLIHYSTDYVFDGAAARAYTETDLPNPVSAYGRSKLAGEHAIRQTQASHLTLRTSWVYAQRGQNFLRTMLRLMREREELRVVDDQFGAPTWGRTIADITAAVLARAGSTREAVSESLRERGGTLHLTAAGETTWCGFAAAIRDGTTDPKRILRTITPITTAQYPTPAARPANSRLSCDRLRQLWQVHLPTWTEALRLCLNEQPDGVHPAPATS